MTDKTTPIVFPIFDRMTHLDFTGPHEVFSSVSEARITVASMGGRDVETRRFSFSGLADLREVENGDVLCVPGGSGTTEAMLDEPFMVEIRRLAHSARYLTSVCTGALILGAAGLLRGRRATTHWAMRDLLQPLGATSDDARVVRGLEDRPDPVAGGRREAGLGGSRRHIVG